MYIPTLSPLGADPALRAYIEREFRAIALAFENPAAASEDVRGYGVVGDGIRDDTTALANALAASEHVIVPAGFTPRITSSLTIERHGRLQFLGGPGNTQGQYPAAYLIKDAAMTTPGIILQECSMLDGGGLVCETGNTGNGIEIRNNSAIVDRFLVHGAGGDGVRVGRDGLAGGNYNSFKLVHVVSQNNGGHGFLIHDGKTDPENGANANAGTLTQCFSHHNAGDGFQLGFSWWVTLLNCLSEVNTGYGLNLSGEEKVSYPACRWATIVGGDYNESNTAGIINDPAYFSMFVMPDANQLPATASNGLQGSALRTVAGGFRLSVPPVGVASLPSAAPAGGIVYVPNESGGAVLAFSDGTNWRRVTDRAIVS